MPALFNSTQHMRVSEVRDGMKGYGLSVFHGTAIERFDVEVISVLKNQMGRNRMSCSFVATDRGSNIRDRSRA